MIRDAVKRARMGDVMACCDPSMSTLDQIFSNTCQYCFGGQAQSQQQLMQQPQNQGNTTGIPCCDPSAGFFANLFSNTCNTCDPVGNVLGSGGLGLTGNTSLLLITGAVVLGAIILLGGRR